MHANFNLKAEFARKFGNNFAYKSGISILIEKFNQIFGLLHVYTDYNGK